MFSRLYLFININIFYVYIWCILQLPALTSKLHRPQMQYFCMNIFPGLLMWRQTSSRQLCPQNSPEESLWPTTADPSLSMSWMSTSANYTTYLRRQERAWWGKHFLINVNATCVCSALVHRLIHFCVFLRMELCLMKILFWLKWGRMKTDDLDLTLRCVFGYWLHFLEDEIEYHKS